MYRITALFAGGLVAALALTGFDAGAFSARGGNETQVNRLHKGDRLNIAESGQIPGTSTSPSGQMTVVSKTGREHIAPPAQDVRNPTATSRDGATPRTRRLVGCDPVVSPLAAPSLAHIAGRCLA